MADKLATLSQLKTALQRIRARIEQVELTPGPQGPPGPTGNLIKQETIPNGADLDEYIADGLAAYKTENNNGTAKILHKPDGLGNVSFSLFAARGSIGDSYVQILIPYIGAAIYQRRKEAGTWNAWTMLSSPGVHSSMDDPGAGSQLTSGEVLVVYE